jgi:signal transduction histidine kinase/ABC-type amino acid transport substrate-binding protein
MKRSIILYILLALFIAIRPSVMSAKDFYEYTEERPLIIACDWDFRPFEFLDSEGEPAGYNVEVLDIILNRLEIPHKFVMQEWHTASEMFIHHDADLLHALSSSYKNRPYILTKKYINYYNIRAARRVDAPPFKGLFKTGRGVKIGVKKNDFAALRVREHDNIPFTVEYLSPKEGLTRVRAHRCDYYIWGQIPLEKKIQELGIDSLALDEVKDIAAGELHIVGYEMDLIDAIDDQYTRLEQAGELQRIYDKWFRPERSHDDASPLAPFILIGLAVAGIVVFLAGRVLSLRVRASVRRNTELNSIMTQALDMDEYFVLEYDVVLGIVKNAYGRLLPDSGIAIEELIERIAPEERDEFRGLIDSMKRGDCESWFLQRRYNSGTSDEPCWRTYVGGAILERVNGSPRYIVHTVKDITRDLEEEQRNKELADKYMKVFETNMMAMSFHDAEGHLINMNQRMRDLLEITGEREQHFRKASIFEDPFLKGYVDQGHLETFHVCGRMLYQDWGLDKYIETRIVPVKDDTGQLVYYIITSRDVTAERDMYMKQREHERHLKETHSAINRYENQLRYLLEESNMYVWTFNQYERVIRFTRSLRQTEYSLSLEEFLAGMDDSYRPEAERVIQEQIMQGKPFNVIHQFNYTPVTDTLTWFAISGIPVLDKDGRPKEYFGLVRDITDLMLAQKKLREETERANDSGRLKSAFLANMTHEIRTPLNAIVGFSDLLQMVDSPDERREFIRIIRNNCDMLLRLINDILEASSMGQAIAIEAVSLDLPPVFDDICQTLEQRVQGTGVEFMKDNPYDALPVVMDKGRLQQLLTNFVTNAVKYTKDGHIRVGYRKESRDINRQRREGLFFYCEDTGAGIPKEKQASVFERFVKLNDFVQGTGLGLAICKAIVDKCGGRIGVTSEGEGYGSTFWFWLPNDITKG